MTAAGPVRRLSSTAAVLVAFAFALHVAQVDPARLVTGLPRMAGWVARSWPPSTSEFGAVLFGALETLAIASVGTAAAALLAVTLCFAASRNITPEPFLYYPARWIANFFRAIDSFVFALLFVAAVGIGPFAGAIGVALHTAGSMIKLWSESIEAADGGPFEAARLAGANRLQLVSFVVMPDALASMASTMLYLWEFNVRASTALGLVGAGGIGQLLKNSMDLLDFPKLATILIVILVMVGAIDQISATLRRRLLA